MSRTEYLSLRRRGRYLLNRGITRSWSQYEQGAIVLALNTRQPLPPAA